MLFGKDLSCVSSIFLSFIFFFFVFCQLVVHGYGEEGGYIYRGYRGGEGSYNRRDSPSSQQEASTPLLALAHLQRRPCGHLEDVTHAILGLGRALQVAEGADAVGHIPALLWLHRLLGETMPDIIGQIFFFYYSSDTFYQYVCPRY